MAIFGDVIFEWDDGDRYIENCSCLIKISDTHLLEGGYDDLYTLDITIPAATSIADHISTPIESNWVFEIDPNDPTTVYASRYSGDSIWSLNVADPENISLRDSVNNTSTFGGPNGLTIIGDRLYFCGCRDGSGQYDWIGIIDVTDPDNLGAQQYFYGAEITGTTSGINKFENYIVFVASSNLFMIWDTTDDPDNPTFVGSCAITAGHINPCKRIAIDADGEYCYLAFYSDGVDIIDMRDKENPALVGTMVDATYNENVYGVQVSGNFLFYGNQIYEGTANPRVTCYNITDRVNPAFLETMIIGDKMSFDWQGLRQGWLIDPDDGETIYLGRHKTNTDYGFAIISVTLPVDGVYVEFAGTEVQSQCYGSRTERGRETELGYAPAGVAELTMDNSEGDFSPENAAGAYYGTLDLGISVYIYEVYGGVTYPLFTGQIEKIVPQDVAGSAGAQAFILCTDGMDDLNGTIVETPLRTSVKGGQLIEDILDDAEAFVGARDIDTGITTFDVAFFSGKEALPQIRSIEDQERGRFYIDVDGDAQFEDRHHRILNHQTSEYDFGTKLRNIAYEWSKRDLYNRIQITGTKYTEDATSEYLWGTEAGVAATAVIVPANGSITIWATFSQVLASYTALVAGTHWNTNTEIDKSGTDTTASVSLVTTQYGKAIKMVFTSTFNADSYLVVPDSPPAGADANRTAIVMGKLYQEDVIQHVETYATSITNYRKKGMSLTTPFLGDPDELRTLATFIGDRHKDPQPMAIRVTIHARTDWPTDDILRQVLTRKISDRITLASTLLGFDQDFYIEKVIHDYKQFEGKFNLDVTWVCSRASEQDSLTWLLETEGFGELEETTYLSY